MRRPRNTDFPVRSSVRASLATDQGGFWPPDRSENGQRARPRPPDGPARALVPALGTRRHGARYQRGCEDACARRLPDDHPRSHLRGAVDTRLGCGELCQRQPQAAALGRCSAGRAAGAVHERKGRPRRDQGIGRADRLDALRRFLHLRPFERSLRGAGDDLEPTARRARAGVGAIAGDRDSKSRAAAMVQHAYIAGKIETDEGVLGDQAIAIVPVEILCV